MTAHWHPITVPDDVSFDVSHGMPLVCDELPLFALPPHDNDTAYSVMRVDPGVLPETALLQWLDTTPDPPRAPRTWGWQHTVALIVGMFLTNLINSVLNPPMVAGLIIAALVGVGCMSLCLLLLTAHTKRRQETWILDGADAARRAGIDVDRGFRVDRRVLHLIRHEDLSLMQADEIVDISDMLTARERHEAREDQNRPTYGLPGPANAEGDD